MKLLPFETFTIQTPLSKEAAHKALKSEVMPKNYVIPSEKRAKGLGKLFYRDLRKFSGKINKTDFILSQRFPLFSRGHPSFKGTFETRQKVTYITITIGSIIGQVIAFLFFIGATFFSYKANNLFILIFTWSFIRLPFWYEVRQIKKQLEEVFITNNLT